MGLFAQMCPSPLRRTASQVDGHMYPKTPVAATRRGFCFSNTESHMAKSSPTMMRKVAVSVFCINAEGEPDVYQVTVETSEPSYRDGDHLETAKLMAQKDGLTPKYAADEEDMLRVILPALEALYEYFTKARGRVKL